MQSYNMPRTGASRLGLWNLWAFTPFFVIGLAMIPNAIKIVMAQSTPAYSVKSRPWEASRSFDDQRIALSRFQDQGLALEPNFFTDGAAMLRLTANEGFDYTRLGPLMLHCYRPDQPDMDRVLQVRAGETIFDLSALPSGSWVLTFTGQLDGLELRHSLRINRPDAASVGGG